MVKWFNNFVFKRNTGFTPARSNIKANSSLSTESLSIMIYFIHRNVSKDDFVNTLCELAGFYNIKGRYKIELVKNYVLISIEGLKKDCELFTDQLIRNIKISSISSISVMQSDLKGYLTFKQRKANASPNLKSKTRRNSFTNIVNFKNQALSWPLFKLFAIIS